VPFYEIEFPCSQMWLEKSAETNVVYPKQVTIDMSQSCLYGMTALNIILMPSLNWNSF
jgi:hypothetical protein